MTGTNNFIQFDQSQGNMYNDESYQALSQITNGLGTGIADPMMHNKLFYQLSTMCSAWGQVFSNLGYTVSDASISNLVAVLSNILTANDLWQLFTGDFHNQTSNGFFTTSAVGQANAPGNIDKYYLLVATLGTSVYHLAIDSSSGLMWWEIYNGTAWTTWTQIPGAAGSVTAAMLVSGAAASNIGTGGVTAAMLAAGVALSNLGFTPVNKAGDALTGLLTMLGHSIATVNFNDFKQFTCQATSNTAAMVSANNNPFTNSGSIGLTLGTGTSGANGLDTGTLTASTWYYVHIIYGTSGTACMMSLSATAPTLPSGYTQFIRVGAIKTDSSSNLMRTLQLGRRAVYVVTTSTNTASLPQMASGSAGNVGTPTFVAISTSSFVPPTASAVELQVIPSESGGTSMLVASNSSYSVANSFMFSAQNTYFSFNQDQVYLVLESSNIYWASNGTSYINCKGWEDLL